MFLGVISALFGGNLPSWVNNPNDGVYLGVAVVVNKASDESSYMYEQKIKAMVQKELSQQIKTKVQSEYQKSTIIDSFGSTIIIDNTSLQTSQNKIENIIIKERFKDGNDEWIWGVMEKPVPKDNSLVIQAYGKNKFIALNNLMQSIKGVQATTKTVLKNSRLTENSSELISSGMVKNYKECPSKDGLVCYAIKVEDVE